MQKKNIYRIALNHITVGQNSQWLQLAPHSRSKKRIYSAGKRPE